MANDLRQYYQAIKDAREVMQDLLAAYDRLKDIQMDYDNAEIPADHKRVNCYQDCGQAVNDAVLNCMHQIKYAMEGDQ